MCVCVCLPDVELEKSGVGSRHHNAPLYSGSVVGELCTSGCFLQESVKHRKFQSVCCASTRGSVCLMENRGALELRCPDVHTHTHTGDEVSPASARTGDVAKQKAA